MITRLKRLYLMAHAPAEPQPWFKPRAEPLASQMPTVPAKLSDEEKRQLSGWQEGVYVLDDLKAPRVRAYAAAAIGHRDLSRAYFAQVEYLRLAQWPAAWADAVLREAQS